MQHNTIGSITLIGLPEKGSGSIHLNRIHASENLVPTIPYPIQSQRRAIPPFPPSHKSPPARPDDGSISVTLQLGELLGDGGTAFVYAATVVSVSKTGDSDSNSDADTQENVPGLPPLAIKMARRMRRGHLAREAWFYDEMHELQGSVIPHCYGWFDAPETPDFQGDVYAPSKDNETRSGHPDDYPEPWSEELQFMSVPWTRISVIVLERLGGLIPTGVQHSADMKEDILALGDDTGYVDIVDIRRGNILHAYEGPGALPNEPSPVTGRVHLWRVVDLEGCRKAHNFPKHHVMRWRDYARHLMAP